MRHSLGNPTSSATVVLTFPIISPDGTGLERRLLSIPTLSKINSDHSLFRRSKAIVLEAIVQSIYGCAPNFELMKST
ncbi:hypothetical protein ES708_06950 [subsurface metagenome]